MEDTKLTLIRANLNRYTFNNFKIREWVEGAATGQVLNLFSGKTLLNLPEIRVDSDIHMNAHHHMDALDFTIGWHGKKFDTIILDPPYSYRKSMEMYNGNRNSKFKRLADELPRILTGEGVVISLGYHSTFLGKVRNFDLLELCVFAHGGAQHCTIGIVEGRHGR